MTDTTTPAPAPPSETYDDGTADPGETHYSGEEINYTLDGN